MKTKQQKIAAYEDGVIWGIGNTKLGAKRDANKWVREFFGHQTPCYTFKFAPISEELVRAVKDHGGELPFRKDRQGVLQLPKWLSKLQQKNR